MNEINKEDLMDKMAENLPVLRAKLGLTQDELSKMVGISRSSIILFEKKQRKMTWNTFLSFVLIFSKNDETQTLLSALEIYTEELNRSLEIKKKGGMFYGNSGSC